MTEKYEIIKEIKIKRILICWRIFLANILQRDKRREEKRWWFEMTDRWQTWLAMPNQRPNKDVSNMTANGSVILPRKEGIKRFCRRIRLEECGWKKERRLNVQKMRTEKGTKKIKSREQEEKQHQHQQEQE